MAYNKKQALHSAISWLNSTSPKHLEAAENLAKEISLYAWLAHKFPEHFYEFELVSSFRNEVSRYIERALLIQAGYQDTSKELMYKNGIR